MAVNRLFKCALAILLIALLMIQEAEGRRKILRGRKVLTRYFMRESAIPSYIMVILIGIGQIVLGGILYILLKCCIIDKRTTPLYRRAPMTPSNT